MDISLQRVFLPCVVVGLDIDLLESVECDDVKIPDGVVVFRRVSGACDDPAVRNAVSSEYLVLKELEHQRRQGLRHAVDLVEEEDALLHSGLFHELVYGRDDLAHRVLGDIVLLTVVDLVAYERKSDGALPRVMGHGIRNDADAELCGYLLHYSGLAYPRRSDQKDRSLLLDRDGVCPELILREIRFDCISYLCLGFADVHCLLLRSVVQLFCSSLYPLVQLILLQQYSYRPHRHCRQMVAVVNEDERRPVRRFCLRIRPESVREIYESLEV